MIPISRISCVALTSFALAAMAGCASTTPSTLLSLPAASSATELSTVRAVRPSMPVLAVSRVDVPEYLVSRRVRYKIDSSTVGEWPETYWAERVEVAISREFHSALQLKMPDWRVCEANCTPLGAVASLQVAVLQLDYVRSERRLVGKVRLSLEDRSLAHLILRGEERTFQVIATSDTAQAQAQAVSELLRCAAYEAAALVAIAVPKAPSQF